MTVDIKKHEMLAQVIENRMNKQRGTDMPSIYGTLPLKLLPTASAWNKARLPTSPPMTATPTPLPSTEQM